MSDEIKKDFFSKTPEELAEWLKKFDDIPEPSGCLGCGAIAGCCTAYPNCPGNPNWHPGENENGQ